MKIIKPSAEAEAKVIMVILNIKKNIIWISSPATVLLLKWRDKAKITPYSEVHGGEGVWLKI